VQSADDRDLLLLKPFEHSLETDESVRLEFLPQAGGKTADAFDGDCHEQNVRVFRQDLFG